MILLLKLGEEGETKLERPRNSRPPGKGLESGRVEGSGRTKCFSSLSGFRTKDTDPGSPRSNQQVVKEVL